MATKHPTIEGLCGQIDEYLAQELISMPCQIAAQGDLRWVWRMHRQVPCLIGGEPSEGVVTIGWAGLYNGEPAVMCVGVRADASHEYGIFDREGKVLGSDGREVSWAEINERLTSLFTLPKEEEEESA